MIAARECSSLSATENTISSGYPPDADGLALTDKLVLMPEATERRSSRATGVTRPFGLHVLRIPMRQLRPKE